MNQLCVINGVEMKYPAEESRFSYNVKELFEGETFKMAEE